MDTLLKFGGETELAVKGLFGWRLIREGMRGRKKKSHKYFYLARRGKRRGKEMG